MQIFLASFVLALITPSEGNISCKAQQSSLGRKDFSGFQLRFFKRCWGLVKGFVLFGVWGGRNDGALV